MCARFWPAAERGNVSVSGAEEVDQGVGSDAGSSVLFSPVR
ncbi:MAG: hypothetical protein R2874_15800 [Desulfobacterales bacterium]